MPRRNNRGTQYEPLDLTADEVRTERPQGAAWIDRREAARQRDERERERRERQRAARVNGGIDWRICIVPGCGDTLPFGYLHNDPARRDHTVCLPMCFEHLFVAAEQARTHADDPLMVNAAAEVLARKQAKAQELKAAAKKAWLTKRDGHIYFLRQNGRIKAGWSREVDERIRSYGPDVEVLCVYPASFDDETNLHRQLKPALVAGREWYEDGPIVAAFVTEAIATHGPPRVYDGWSRPKEVIKPRKRSA